MSRRRFEMYQYRQVLVRMRQGDSDRDIDRTGLMGRKKLGQPQWDSNFVLASNKALLQQMQR